MVTHRPRISGKKYIFVSIRSRQHKYAKIKPKHLLRVLRNNERHKRAFWQGFSSIPTCIQLMGLPACCWWLQSKTSSFNLIYPPTLFIKMFTSWELKRHSLLLWLTLSLFAVTRPSLSSQKFIPPPVDSEGHAIHYTVLVRFRPTF